MNIDFEQKDRDVTYNNKRAVLRNHPCLNATESARLPLMIRKFKVQVPDRQKG